MVTWLFTQMAAIVPPATVPKSPGTSLLLLKTTFALCLWLPQKSICFTKALMERQLRLETGLVLTVLALVNWPLKVEVISTARPAPTTTNNNLVKLQQLTRIRRRKIPFSKQATLYCKEHARLVLVISRRVRFSHFLKLCNQILGLTTKSLMGLWILAAVTLVLFGKRTLSTLWEEQADARESV